VQEKHVHFTIDRIDYFDEIIAIGGSFFASTMTGTALFILTIEFAEL
jgi:hypothetical protein